MILRMDAIKGKSKSIYLLPNNDHDCASERNCLLFLCNNHRIYKCSTESKKKRKFFSIKFHGLRRKLRLFCRLSEI